MHKSFANFQIKEKRNNLILCLVNSDPVTSHLITFEYTDKANNLKLLVVNGESNHKSSDNVQS